VSDSVRVTVLVPSISASRLERARTWLAALTAEGFDVRVVANSASAAASAPRLSATVVDTGANPGFSRSIVAALEGAPAWDWVLLMNDDLDLAAAAPAAIRRVLADHGEADATIVHLGDEPARALPTVGGVFASVSLLDALRHRFGRADQAGREHRAARRGREGVASTYRSFSAVAISRASWRRVGGLDRRFVFCYEDAFFVRRHRALGGEEPVCVDVGIRHEKSASTGQHIRTVLPAIAFSAFRYLCAIGVTERRASRVVVAALLLRVPLVPFASARTGEHLRGIVAAIRSVSSRREPALPRYADI